MSLCNVTSSYIVLLYIIDGLYKCNVVVVLEAQVPNAQPTTGILPDY